MIIQAVIVVLLLIVLCLIVLQSYVGRVFKTLMPLAVMAGIFLTLDPEIANVVARALGVGRGADLLFYLWILVSFFVFFVLYAQINRSRRQITELTRALALLEAEQRLKPDED